MRVFKAIIVTLIVGGLIFLSISCTGTSGATVAPKTQIATVQKGNISIQVTGTGNLALETKLALSFGQTGQVNNATTAKISEVDVMAGQIVEKGQVLVKADPQDWQDTITGDQHALDSANFNVKLFRFAYGLKKQTYGVIFWAVTVVNSPREMKNVRLAAGSNSASIWWVNGQEAVDLFDDRRMVMDDVVSKRLTLNKGKNIIRGAVINGPGLSDFCVRLIDENGNPIKDVTLSVQ